MFDSKKYLSSIYIIPFIFQVVNYQDHRDFILQNSATNSFVIVKVNTEISPI